MIILSLDISAASTGWSVLRDNKVYYGLIKTKPTKEKSKRLLTFKAELCSILETYKPTHVVIEDIFVGLNAKTIKILAEFGGVAKVVCREFTGKEPYVISTNTVKAYYKCSDKQALFDFMCDLLELSWKYKKDNDLTDALAQLFCHSDLNLKYTSYRKDMSDYGYLYQLNKELLNE